jgi:hypothetical protein
MRAAPPIKPDPQDLLLAGSGHTVEIRRGGQILAFVCGGRPVRWAWTRIYAGWRPATGREEDCTRLFAARCLARVL